MGLSWKLVMVSYSEERSAPLAGAWQDVSGALLL